MSAGRRIPEKRSQPVRNGEGYDFFAFPVVDKEVPKSALGPIDGIVLTSQSTNHEFAKSVLAYFTEDGPQMQMSQGSGALAPSLHVPHSFYSPFKQRLLDEIGSASTWAFNYDLATPPSVADRGMDSFSELIAFPGQYRRILADLQQDVVLIRKNMDGRQDR